MIRLSFLLTSKKFMKIYFQAALQQASLELQQAHDISQNQRRRTVEILSNVAGEINDIGQILSAISGPNSYQIQLPFSMDSAMKNEKLDEDFMVTKLQMSRLKSDIRNFVQVPPFRLSIFYDYASIERLLLETDAVGGHPR